jgi:hypothetical protein
MTVRNDIQKPLGGAPEYRAISISTITVPGGVSPATFDLLPVRRASNRASASSRTLPWPLRAAAPRPTGYGSKVPHNSRLVAWQALPGKLKWTMDRVGFGVAPQVTVESDSEFAKRGAMDVGAGATCSGALNRSVLRRPPGGGGGPPARERPDVGRRSGRVLRLAPALELMLALLRSGRAWAKACQDSPGLVGLVAAGLCQSAGGRGPRDPGCRVYRHPAASRVCP